MTESDVNLNVLDMPLEEIREDIFFRVDNFKDKEWYGHFQVYLHIGVCQTTPEYALEMRKALKVMGFSTRATERDGKMYLVPQKEKPPQEPQNMEKAHER